MDGRGGEDAGGSTCSKGISPGARLRSVYVLSSLGVPLRGCPHTCGAILAGAEHGVVICMTYLGEWQ